MKITLAKTPASVRNPKMITKMCQEKGCTSEFTGHPVRKYCDVHRNPKNRRRVRPVFDDVTESNRIIDHSFRESHDIEIKCMYKDCKNIVKIRLHPRVNVYPKYCTEHRQKHKRMEIKCQIKN